MCEYVCAAYLTFLDLSDEHHHESLLSVTQLMEPKAKKKIKLIF
jgi:hypothetical protein